MSIRRIGSLLQHDLRQGASGFILILAVVVPLVLTLTLHLLVGNLFSATPRLGIVDAGQSALPGLLEAAEGVAVQRYTSADSLRTALQEGKVEMGVVLSADFDTAIRSDTPAPLTVLVRGESLLSDRAFIAAALATGLRTLTGDQSRVTLITETLGEETPSWQTRLFPLIVLMAVVLGGTLVPATSLVQEKQNRTLPALVTSAASLEELLVAKGLLGVVVSLFTGIGILVLNRAWGAHPWLLVGLLALSAVMAACIGLLLGILVRDINTLFATMKGLGMVLYAPALFMIFPNLPQWIGQLFPTWYMINPIVALVQRGAGWQEVRGDVIILAGLNLALIGLCALLARRTRTRPELMPGLT
jgi:ABC-2 type transport system permease protein